jgi:D-inositol-3-phosphate glycosyltransferase
MKAILLGPAHPLKGGIANFNESLAIAFIKNSIETEIVTFYYQYPAFLFPGETQKAEGKAPYSLKIKSLISSINPWSWIKTARFIAHESPDLVIVQYWMPFMAPALGTILRFMSKKHVPKVIAIVHNAKPHEKRFGDNVLTKYFANTCHGFVCLSKSVLTDLDDYTYNPNKVFVPHPVYDIFGDKISKKEARKYLGIKDEEKVLLFFGIIRKYKGLELLLNSLAEEKVKNLGVKLIVAGEFYEDKQHYLALANRLNLSDNIIFTNKFIPTESVKYYFCASDIIVQPYLNATQSGVTQIAYNFERPMLVTNVGGLAEIVFDKHTGYVTEVDAKSIAEAIVDFYVNNREATMSANVALEQYRFTWHAMVDAIINLSENLK